MALPIEEGNGGPSLKPLWALMPYLWPRDAGLRMRVVLSLLCMMLGIAATFYFPLLMGQITNRLAVRPVAAIAMGLTLGLVGAYVASRILMQAFAQLRDGIFAKVLYQAMRQVAVQT